MNICKEHECTDGLDCINRLVDETGVSEDIVRALASVFDEPSDFDELKSILEDIREFL